MILSSNPFLLKVDKVDNTNNSIIVYYENSDIFESTIKINSDYQAMNSDSTFVYKTKKELSKDQLKTILYTWIDITLFPDININEIVEDLIKFRETKCTIETKENKTTYNINITYEQTDDKNILTFNVYV